MIKELTDFIRHLSINDKKTLTQKALKTTEEVGELAKAVLPFENASGTLHRFSDRTKILDSVADVYLTSISIAYGMGFTDEEIEEMIRRKAKKWSGLQANEENVKFPLPYEIHVTVEAPKNLEWFKSTCEEIGVKPIIIDLEKNGDLIMSDVMTSSVHFGNNATALLESERIVRALMHGNDILQYNVLRTKIETVPWHPAAPSKTNGVKMKEGNYFESHLRIVTTEDRRPQLENIATSWNAHLSRNFFKKISENEYIIMMTLRDYNTTSEEFKTTVDNLKYNLINLYNFEVDKIEIEFAIYDTNVTHDIDWIKQ